jgi:hypothetical protein
VDGLVLLLHITFRIKKSLRKLCAGRVSEPACKASLLPSFCSSLGVWVVVVKMFYFLLAVSNCFSYCLLRLVDVFALYRRRNDTNLISVLVDLPECLFDYSYSAIIGWSRTCSHLWFVFLCSWWSFSCPCRVLDHNLSACNVSRRMPWLFQRGRVLVHRCIPSNDILRVPVILVVHRRASLLPPRLFSISFHVLDHLLVIWFLVTISSCISNLGEARCALFLIWILLGYMGITLLKWIIRIRRESSMIYEFLVAVSDAHGTCLGRDSNGLPIQFLFLLKVCTLFCFVWITLGSILESVLSESSRRLLMLLIRLRNEPDLTVQGVFMWD